MRSRVRLPGVAPQHPMIEPLQAALSDRAEVLEAYLFGSAARGDAMAHSDVDVAVYLSPSALSRPGFGVAAEIDIDVVVLNNAPPVLYHGVLRDGVRLFAKDLAATTVREGQALSRYCDYVPQLRKIGAAHSARIAAGNFGR
jgi:uncharacterized protein